MDVSDNTAGLVGRWLVDRSKYLDRLGPTETRALPPNERELEGGVVESDWQPWTGSPTVVGRCERG